MITDRKEFVEGPLQALIKAARDDVQSVTYIHHGQSQSEQVEIVFTNGYKKYACIDADSPMEIIRDVTKFRVLE